MNLTYDSYLPYRRLSSGVLHDYYGGILYRYYLHLDLINCSKIVNCV